MTTSESINEIATALAKAQGEMGGAVKDSANPFFKSKYADLASVWDACRGPLSKNGLAIVQSPSAEGMRVSVDTLLTHTSGQWMRGVVSVNAKEDTPQAIGSAITYLRRYALQSFAGVAPEDDDAETAQGRGNGNGRAHAVTPFQNGTATTTNGATVAPKGYPEWLDDLRAVAEEGTQRLEQAWRNSKAEYRQYLTTATPRLLDQLKEKAARSTVAQ